MPRIYGKIDSESKLLRLVKEEVTVAVDEILEKTPEPLLRKRFKIFARELRRADEAGIDPENAATIALLRS